MAEEIVLSGGWRKRGVKENITIKKFNFDFDYTS